ncbi:MAG: hypothetical protein ACYC1C_05970 [Chloroflexota bacterium]
MPTDLSRLIWPQQSPDDGEELANEQAAWMTYALRRGAERIMKQSDALAETVSDDLIVEMIGEACLALAPLTGGPLARKIMDEALVTIVVHEDAVWERLRHLPAEERAHGIYRLAAELIGDLFAFYRQQPDGAPADTAMLTLLRRMASKADRLRAAEELAETAKYKRPIPRKRWRFHEAPLSEILRERPTAVREATVEALMIIGLEASRLQEYVYLSVNGSPKKVVCPPNGLVPYVALPPRYFEAWFQSQVGSEVMSALLPGWRERERAWRAQRGLAAEEDQSGQRPRDPEYDGAAEMSLEELRALAGETASAPVGATANQDVLAAVVAAENDRESRERFDSLLAYASPQQAGILRCLLECIETGHDGGHGLFAEAARRLGIPEEQVRNQMARLRQRFKKRVKEIQK